MDLDDVDIPLETAAYDFIEQEVGRIDWRRNWEQMRKEQDMVTHASVWIRKMNLDLDARELVQWLDDFVAQQRGAWR